MQTEPWSGECRALASSLARECGAEVIDAATLALLESTLEDSLRLAAFVVARYRWALLPGESAVDAALRLLDRAGPMLEQERNTWRALVAAA